MIIKHALQLLLLSPDAFVPGREPERKGVEFSAADKIKRETRGGNKKSDVRWFTHNPLYVLWSLVRPHGPHSAHFLKQARSQPLIANGHANIGTAGYYIHTDASRRRWSRATRPQCQVSQTKTLAVKFRWTPGAIMRRLSPIAAFCFASPQKGNFIDSPSCLLIQSNRSCIQMSVKPKMAKLE